MIIMNYYEKLKLNETNKRFLRKRCSLFFVNNVSSTIFKTIANWYFQTP